MNTPELEQHIGGTLAKRLRDDVELITGVYPAFNREEYLAGRLAPVFFGSALNNFGVKELLDCFIEIAPSPRPVQAIERTIDPYEEEFTGFVFKIPRMDPNTAPHRLLKVCSGRFSGT